LRDERLDLYHSKCDNNQPSFAGRCFHFVYWKRKIEKIILFFVSFAAGALFGDAIIHLLPESFEEIESSLTVSLLVLSGIIFFFVLEKFIHWRHCHVLGSENTSTLLSP